MGRKKTIWTRLFGSKPENGEDKQAQEQLVQESKKEQTVTEPPPPAVETELELPREHALHTLCDMRAQRAGSLSRPRLRLEGREDFTNVEMHKELGRLQRVLTLAANSRLKEVRAWEKEAALRAEKAAASKDIKPGEIQEPEGNRKTEEAPPPLAMDALPVIHIAADKLSAWMMVFPPVGEGKELDQQMLDEALQKSGVTFGVDEGLVLRLPDQKERYFFLFNVAKGKPAVQGKDGYIIEHFDRVVERKFKVDERDRVDYASLKFFQSVEKGDVISEAVPPVKGEPGRTVLDQEISVKNGKTVSLNKGRNTEISKDGAKLVASKPGHVEYAGHCFQVNSVLEIDDNVNYGTGNIDYMGDVHIRGNVCSGFTVKAAGNVVIDGVVEAGCVDAGGDLIVAKGIVGNSQAVVRAEHKVYAKYLENSIVHAKESLKADCIVNSDVYSDGEIEVCNGRGTIVGGRIRAARKVSAKIVGSKSESQTAIFLGGEPCMEYERENLEKVIEKNEKELEKLMKRPDSPSTLVHIRQMQLDLEKGRTRLQEMDAEMAQKEEEVQSHGGSRLVSDLVYPGLTLTINDVMVRLKQQTSKCNARLVDGEIKFL